MRATALLVVCLALATPGFAGTIAGQVELLEKGGKKATDLSDVVVYVEGGRGKIKPATVTMSMKGKAFIPRVIVVPVGGKVEFPNEDPLFHNVFSISKENSFDLGLYKRPKAEAWTFQNPGVTRVYCNIHPQMSAIVVVRDSPYYAKASKEGMFALEDIPAGKYKLFAFHERGGEAAMDVTVPAEGQVGAKLLLDASKYKLLPHKNKEGKPYGPGEKY